MSTTADQTWVRRAGRYFIDVPGFTYRLNPGLGTAWHVYRQAEGEQTWQLVVTVASLKAAKAAALQGDA